MVACQDRVGHIFNHKSINVGTASCKVFLIRNNLRTPINLRNESLDGACWAIYFRICAGWGWVDGWVDGWGGGRSSGLCSGLGPWEPTLYPFWIPFGIHDGSVFG